MKEVEQQVEIDTSALFLKPQQQQQQQQQEQPKSNNNNMNGSFEVVVVHNNNNNDNNDAAGTGTGSGNETNTNLRESNNSGIGIGIGIGIGTAKSLGANTSVSDSLILSLGSSTSSSSENERYKENSKRKGINNNEDDDDDDDESKSTLGSSNSNSSSNAARRNRFGTRTKNNNNSDRSSSNNTNQRGSAANRLRHLVIFLFTNTAVFLPLVIYTITRNREVSSFESDYKALSLTVTENFAIKIAQTIHALDYIAVSATSHAIHSNSTWPFVTIPDFDMRGASVLRYSSSLAYVMRVIVTNETRHDYEEYTRNHMFEWIDQTEQRQNHSFQVFYPQEFPTDETLQVKNGIVQELFAVGATLTPIPLEGPGPYFPAWQAMPLVKDLVNLNSVPSDLEAINTVVATSEAIIDTIGIIPPFLDNAYIRYFNAVLQHSLNDPTVKYSGEPVSSIFYPVFDSFTKDRKIVAFINSAIFWNAFFQDILPPNSNGVICVVQNDCVGDYTFAIDGNGATYIGLGDLHQKAYEDYAIVYDLEEAERDGLFSFSATTVPLNHEFCPYRLIVYPSDQLRDQHFTREPPFYALGVALVFLVVLIISSTYDCVVKRRMRQIVQAADENKAIVASFFPEAVRARLFDNNNNNNNNNNNGDGNNNNSNDTGPVYAMGASNKTRLKALLGVKDSNNNCTRNKESQTLSSLIAEPVADLFPYCTVLFADISGFSAWSSERQPEQVFTLLETIFQTFDKIARRRRVFKVETIGDSYVAVTGLPEKQPDHAIRMARFARDCMTQVNTLVKMLEATLGPDTGDLKMRFGLHSGQVTAGVLRGEKSRFQLFGDTVNTAARMESTGIKNRIQLSHTTAQLLIDSGKESWIIPREDTVKAKGKGVIQTYWMIYREQQQSRDDESAASRNSFLTNVSDEISPEHHTTTSNMEDLEDLFAADPKEGVWGDQALFIAPPSSRIAKSQRLVNWLTDIIAHDLKRVAAHRNIIVKSSKKSRKGGGGGGGKGGGYYDEEIIDNPEDRIEKADMPLEEVVEAFSMPGFNAKVILRPEDIEAIELPEKVKVELHDFVSRISNWYRTNPFHNFEHASHVTMSSVKLLNRIVTPEGIDYAHDNVEMIAADMHTHTFGIVSDPLAQFAITIAALIHDVDHMGVPNYQVAKEVPNLGAKYKQQSIAEQNSIDIAWKLLMEPNYRTLQGFIFHNEKELRRFRQYLVNMVCATDIFNKDMKALRNQRWDKAFSTPNVQPVVIKSDNSRTSLSDGSNEDMSLKATIVLEHIIQAADVSHTMQHWNVYKKWNERLFQEMYSAYDNGRAENDPSEGWYKGELWFFDNYIIPLAQKLEECGVFGVSSDECLNYALENRKEWALKGKDIVKEMSQRYHKRKMLEVDGFTNDEIENFTSEDLDYLIHRLVKKGRTFATFKGEEDEGLENAAKAWFHAFELYERSHVAGKISDKTLVFAIYSGLFIFLKGGMILQDDHQHFEVHLAKYFCEKTKSANAIHKSRALAMKCEVVARHKNFKLALAKFEELDETYNIEEHSQRMIQYYGTDRAAQIYSQRALWYHILGNTEEEIKCCEYTVDKILPWMDTKNVLNTFELLYPVIRLQKEHGKALELSEVFERYIMEEFKSQLENYTLCRPIIAPLSMVLRLLSKQENNNNNNNNNKNSYNEPIDDVLEYLNDDDESMPVKAFLDRLYGRIGWAPNSIIAELCLLAAQNILARNNINNNNHHDDTENDQQQQQQQQQNEQLKKLVQKGVYLTKMVKLRLKGLLGVECAMEINGKVMDELISMAETLGCNRPGSISSSTSSIIDEDPLLLPADEDTLIGHPLKTHLGEIRLAI